MIFQNLIDMLKKTWKYLAFALIATAVLRYYLGPTFFDVFGLLIFAGLVFAGLWQFYTKKKLPDYVAFAFIVIGLMGLIVDGATSYKMLNDLIRQYLIYGK